MTNETYVYVVVEADGEPENDPDAEGVYEFRIDASVPAELRANAALDEMGCTIEMESPDDFLIFVLDADGNEIQEGDADSYTLDDCARLANTFESLEQAGITESAA